jgi:guanylate kinase
MKKLTSSSETITTRAIRKKEKFGREFFLFPFTQKGKIKAMKINKR